MYLVARHPLLRSVKYTIIDKNNLYYVYDTTYSVLYIKTYKICYEAKIEESEKAGFFTFLNFHLITSKFIYFQRMARCSEQLYINLFPQLEKLSLRQLKVAWQIGVADFVFEDNFMSNTDICQ